MSPKKTGYGLLVVAALAALGGPVAAQNIDQGKPAPKLFAESCAACHRSARGLAKGRFRLTLYLFLQQHYASNSSAAWALTSYLESVDTPTKRGGPRVAAKPQAAASSKSGSSARPPMPVPTR